MNVTIPFTAHQYPYLMHYGGGWVQESPHGSDGYTSVVAPRPQLSNTSHDQTNDGSCVPTFNPRLLTAQFAQKDNDGRIGIFGVNGKAQWVADSGATFHVTSNLVGVVECDPPPPGGSTLVMVAAGAVFWKITDDHA